MSGADDANDGIDIQSDRGVAPETRRALEDRFDARFERLNDEPAVLDSFRYPDADVAREFFDRAEQYSEIEVEVELDGTTAIIVGEVGYQWDVVVKTDGGLREVIPEYELTIEGGHVVDRDEGVFRVRYLGLWNDRTDLYERVRDLLEQVNDIDPPRHRRQAFSWKVAAESRSVVTDDSEDRGEQSAESGA